MIAIISRALLLLLLLLVLLLLLLLFASSLLSCAEMHTAVVLGTNQRCRASERDREREEEREGLAQNEIEIQMPPLSPSSPRLHLVVLKRKSKGRCTMHTHAHRDDVSSLF